MQQGNNAQPILQQHHPTHQQHPGTGRARRQMPPCRDHGAQRGQRREAGQQPMVELHGGDIAGEVGPPRCEVEIA